MPPRRWNSAYARARELCQQVGETPQLFPVLRGSGSFIDCGGVARRRASWGSNSSRWPSMQRGPRAPPGGPQCAGGYLVLAGRVCRCPHHLEQGLPSTTPSSIAPMPSAMGRTPGCTAASMAAWACGCWAIRTRRWQRSHEALTLAQELAHPFSLALCPAFAAYAPSIPPGGPGRPRAGRGSHRARDRAGVSRSGWRGGRCCGAGRWRRRDRERRGSPRCARAWRPAGPRERSSARPYFLALLAEAYGEGGQTDEGLRVLAEALAACRPRRSAATRRSCIGSQGELLLRTSLSSSRGGNLSSPGPGHCPPPAGQILELRAAMSLSRLWQQQGKRPKPTSCSRRSTAGSPRALTPPTCRRRRRCLKNGHDWPSP